MSSPHDLQTYETLRDGYAQGRGTAKTLSSVSSAVGSVTPAMASLVAGEPMLALVAVAVGVVWFTLASRISALIDGCLLALFGVVVAVTIRGGSPLVAAAGSVVVLACWDMDRLARQMMVAPATERLRPMLVSHVRVLSAVLGLSLVATILASEVRTTLSWPIVALLCTAALWLIFRIDRAVRGNN